MLFDSLYDLSMLIYIDTNQFPNLYSVESMFFFSNFVMLLKWPQHPMWPNNKIKMIVNIVEGLGLWTGH